MRLNSRILIMVVFLLFQSLIALAAPNIHIEASKKEVRPTEEQKSYWSKDIFEMGEVWVLSSKAEFIKYLQKNAVRTVIVKHLEESIISKLPNNKIPLAMTFYRYTGFQGVIEVTPDLKQQLTHHEKNIIYSYLVKTERQPPMMRFQSKDSARDSLKDMFLNSADINFVIDSLYEIEGYFYFFWTADIWSKLSADLKGPLIKAYTSEHFTRLGLDIFILLDENTDLSGVAEYYSAGRDPNILEKYFKLNFRKGIKKIQLQNVMPLFIRKILNTFTAGSGPNCINACLNSVKEREYRLNFDKEELFFSQVHEYFDLISNDDNLKPGDLIVYLKEDYQSILHAAVFLGHNIVFSKNGVSKFHPYVFQYKNEMEAFYSISPENEARLIYRPKSKFKSKINKCENIY